MGLWVWLSLGFVFPPRASVSLRTSAWGFSPQDPSQGCLSIPSTLKPFQIKGSPGIPRGAKTSRLRGSRFGLLGGAWLIGFGKREAPGESDSISYIDTIR